MTTFDGWGTDPGPPDDDTRARNWDAQMHHTPRNAQPAKRSGKTPEAKVSAAIDKYLDLLGFYVIRTSAGFTNIDGRNIQFGRKGQHDRTTCAPNGRFVSIEIKSEDGAPTPGQLRQREFILRRNGVVVIPHSVDELRSGLVTAFDEQTIQDWERLGRARVAQLRKAKRNR